MNGLRLPLPAPHSRGAYIAFAGAIALAVAMLFTGALVARNTLMGVVDYDLLSDQIGEAKLVVGTLLATVTDAETGQRGYLLTGDPAYLEPYDAARGRLDTELGRLDAASLGDPDRQRGISRLRALTRAKLTEMERSVALRGSGQARPGQEDQHESLGKQDMDSIRDEVDALQDDADAKLAEAGAKDEPVRQWGVVFGLGLMAAVLLAWVVLAQRRGRLQIVANLAQLERFTRAFGVTQGMMRDLEGRIIFWSAGAERLYGYSQQDAIGQISHHLLQTSFPQPQQEIEAALLRDGHWQGELSHCCQGGILLRVASYWALHRGEAGEADAIIEINNDISGLRQAEAELRVSERKLQLALDASDQGVWRWEVGSDTYDLEWDARCKALYGLGPSARADYAFWARAVHGRDRTVTEAAVARALDPADPHDDYDCVYRVVHPDGKVVWLASKGAALFEPDPDLPGKRRAVRMLGTIHDVSDAKTAERERQRANSLLRTILETAPGLIYAKDRQGRMLVANTPVMQQIGKPWEEVNGRTDLEFLGDPMQAEAVMYNDRQIMERDRAETLEEQIGGQDGHARVWFATKAPMRDAEGKVIGLVAVSVEITERKLAEDRLRRMVNELNHRVKNTLTTVQAIASQTLLGVDAAVRAALDNRLLAVASVHDVLTLQKWDGAEVDAVVAGAVLPFGGRDNGRFEIAGPSLLLCPRAAVALAMGLHELASNAFQYGALSVGFGQVVIHWDIVAGDTPMLHLSWIERNGPRVRPPTMRGFGTRLVERSLAADLGGSARICFDDPGGVRCIIDAPLAEVVATDAMSFPRVGTG